MNAGCVFGLPDLVLGPDELDTVLGTFPNARLDLDFILTKPKLCHAAPSCFFQSKPNCDKSPSLDEDVGGVRSYENLQLGHVKTLTGEGFTQEASVKALLISRNDLELARDILQGFSSHP
ncbi:unnamed protein product [Darwinula stevensoni]|uniref:UBA domain-containing protein n=1 Tax=Darwinula stevensoni TaxID=69355 RepID=A0A7R9ACH6_9CRUS|nr:unnamed protein product [Darwinula stevensoni]CAG0900094.1 unnamed protein product [Darwinula stevensoni]